MINIYDNNIVLDDTCSKVKIEVMKETILSQLEEKESSREHENLSLDNVLAETFAQHMSDGTITLNEIYSTVKVEINQSSYKNNSQLLEDEDSELLETLLEDTFAQHIV